MTFNKTTSICNPKHHPQNELVSPDQMLGCMEQRCQVIILDLDKIVIWGKIGLVGVLLGVSQIPS